jgi:hypothetical protein
VEEKGAWPGYLKRGHLCQHADKLTYIVLATEATKFGIKHNEISFLPYTYVR